MILLAKQMTNNYMKIKENKLIRSNLGFTAICIWYNALINKNKLGLSWAKLEFPCVLKVVDILPIFDQIKEKKKHIYPLFKHTSHLFEAP